jgi:hypothetical protein
MTEPFYAHSLPGKPPTEWQPLEEHLFPNPSRMEDWCMPHAKRTQTTPCFSTANTKFVFRESVSPMSTT